MEENFIKILSTTDYVQADIAHDLLEENGIESFVLNKQDSMIPSIGEIEIFVRPEDEESALELLKNFKR